LLSQYFSSDTQKPSGHFQGDWIGHCKTGQSKAVVAHEPSAHKYLVPGHPEYDVQLSLDA
jgi:hypothetical protein